MSNNPITLDRLGVGGGKSTTRAVLYGVLDEEGIPANSSGRTYTQCHESSLSGAKWTGLVSTGVVAMVIIVGLAGILGSHLNGASSDSLKEIGMALGIATSLPISICLVAMVVSYWIWRSEKKSMQEELDESRVRSELRGAEKTAKKWKDDSATPTRDKRKEVLEKIRAFNSSGPDEI